MGGRRSHLAALALALIVMLSACAPSTGTVRGANESHQLTLAVSANRTTAFTGDGVSIAGYHILIIQLDITAFGGTSPTLDVKVQTLIDGTNWCDVAAFTQATGATTRQLVRLSTITTPQAQVACTDGTLAAGTIHQGPLGSQMRIKHATPGGSAGPNFTYSVIVWAGE